MNSLQPYPAAVFLCSVKEVTPNTPFVHVQAVKYDSASKTYVEDTEGRYWGNGAVQVSTANLLLVGDLCNVYDAGFGLIADPVLDAVRVVLLVAHQGGNVWTAQDKATGQALPTGETVLVIGSKAKVGLEVTASRRLRIGSSKTWVANGYAPTQLDFGDDWVTSPFVYEGSMMKLKVQVTNNGYVWSPLKIALDQTGC